MRITVADTDPHPLLEGSKKRHRGPWEHLDVGCRCPRKLYLSRGIAQGSDQNKLRGRHPLARQTGVIRSASLVRSRRECIGIDAVAHICGGSIHRLDECPFIERRLKDAPVGDVLALKRRFPGRWGSCITAICRKHLVFVVVEVGDHSHPELFHVVSARRGVGRFSDCRINRDRDAREQCDDRNHDQEFDEGKSSVLLHVKDIRIEGTGDASTLRRVAKNARLFFMANVVRGCQQWGARAIPDRSSYFIRRPIMKKIVILSASYGEGHNAAARALLAALQKLDGVEAVLLDPCAIALGAAYDRSRSGYISLIERFPSLWAGIYGLLDSTPLIHLMARCMGTLRKTLATMLEAEQPDAIISTYPAYNYLLPKGPFRRFTVVTDSITVNSVWHRCSSDLYYVPNEDTAAVMATAGVKRDRLRVLGFPVDLRFAIDRIPRPTPSATEPIRVLFMINADRARAVAYVEELLRLEGVHLIVTVGRDHALGKEMEAVGKRCGQPLEIYGWTDKAPELMMSSHLLIGKAGGATVQETIAACTPMLITKIVPGQEEGNARLLLQHGCAEVCGTPAALASIVKRLLKDNAAEWHRWEANIRQISRPHAAQEIAESILSELA